MPSTDYRHTVMGYVNPMQEEQFEVRSEGSTQEEMTAEVVVRAGTSNQVARQLEALRRYNMLDRAVPPFTTMEEYIDTDATPPLQEGQEIPPPIEPARDLSSLLPRGMRMRTRRERQTEYTMYPVQVAKSSADEESEAFAKFFVRVKCVEVPFDFEPVEKVPEELEALAKKLREQWVSAVKEWTDKKYESMPI